MTGKQQDSSTLNYQRIVVKLGTGLLTGGGDQLNLEVMGRLAAQVAQLMKRGAEVVIVTSGAAAAGRHKLGLTKKIRDIPYKQVLASVGQSRLMHVYEELFEEHKISVAQALLTKADIADRAGYLNARNTLLALMELKVVCIVNENDVVSTDEIKEAKFGQNDILSAMVANLIDADILMMLTDTKGLYTADPNTDPKAQFIPLVEKIDEAIERIGADTTNTLGTGGSRTKIEAAKLATESGVRVVIANGREPDVIIKLAQGEAIGTHFMAAVDHLESRQRWILSGLCNKGKLTVDDGAALALLKQNRSLLAAGIKSVEGKFRRGDVVEIFNARGTQIACGITNYNASDIDIIKGTQSDKIGNLLHFDYGPEVVHRNNLALLEREKPSASR